MADVPASTFPCTPRGFDALYGLVLDGIDDDGTARAHVEIGPQHLQPYGLVHGGLFAAIAESLTSMATFEAVSGDGRTAQGLSNQASFLRPVLGGTVRAVARPRHRGSTTWVWEVDVLDDQDRVCALVRMTIAVRDAPPAG